MREYAEEGIEHFYFMMLQKDEVGELPFDFYLFALVFKPGFVFLPRRSSSTQPSAVASAASQITPVIQIAMSQNGRLGSIFGWAFSQVVRLRRTRN